jgi:hypothetical protein
VSTKPLPSVTDSCIVFADWYSAHSTVATVSVKSTQHASVISICNKRSVAANAVYVPVQASEASTNSRRAWQQLDHKQLLTTLRSAAMHLRHTQYTLALVQTKLVVTPLTAVTDGFALLVNAAVRLPALMPRIHCQHLLPSAECS